MSEADPAMARPARSSRNALIARAHRWCRAPGMMLGLAVHAIAAVFLVVLLTAIAMPEFGARFDSAGSAVRVTLAGNRTVIVPATAQVTVSSPAGAVGVAAGSLVPDFQPGGGPAEVTRFYRDRDRIEGIARQPGASITVAGTRGPFSGKLERRQRAVTDLPADFWLLTAQAALLALLGVWLRVNRPRDIASWMVGCAGDGVFVAAMSGAIFDARELTASGLLLRAMSTANFIGSNLSAFGLTALFLYAPRRLAPIGAGVALLAIAVAAGILEGMAIIPLAGFYAGLLLSVVALVPIMALQLRATRGDPAGRAVLRWIGATVLTGAASLCLGMAVPILFGLPSLASDGMSIVPVCLIYGGLAFGVRGARMFSLDLWTYRLVLGAVAVMALLVVDLLLVNLLQVEGPVALTVTLLAAGYGYFPLRTYLWNRLAGGAAVDNQTLVRLATLVAFSTGADARRREWRALLDRVFEPAAIEIHDGPVDAPAIEAEGRALLVPAIVDDSALSLRFARRGRRLFGPVELTTLREILALITAADSARAEYARGVNEERQRIARDLHDDVSSHLLTGLHRRDVGDVRGDVRQALGEIRTMVSSLAQPEAGLATILADLRYETAERLRAVDIALTWSGDDGEGVMLDYSRHKALVSGVREAVSNIVRHAGTNAVRIDIAVSGERLLVDIADNGRGLSHDAPSRNGGQGLAGLNHRLAEVGGTFTLTAVSRGCRASLVIPLHGGGAV